MHTMLRNLHENWSHIYRSPLLCIFLFFSIFKYISQPSLLRAVLFWHFPWYTNRFWTALKGITSAFEEEGAPSWGFRGRPASFSFSASWASQASLRATTSCWSITRALVSCHWNRSGWILCFRTNLFSYGKDLMCHRFRDQNLICHRCHLLS